MFWLGIKSIQVTTPSTSIIVHETPAWAHLSTCPTLLHTRRSSGLIPDSTRHTAPLFSYLFCTTFTYFTAMQRDSSGSIYFIFHGIVYHFLFANFLIKWILWLSLWLSLNALLTFLCRMMVVHTLAPSTEEEEFPHVHFKCDIKFDQIYFFPFCLRWKFELLQLQKWK